MISTQLTVRWRDGLHLRPAASLVNLARKFSSSIRLQAGERVADARSIVQLLLLSASLGTAMLVEADGHDEAAAVQAVVELFAETASGT